jgi:hypothetical protein
VIIEVNTDTLLTPLSIVMAFIGVIEATLAYRVTSLQGKAQMIFVWFMVTFPTLVLVGFFYVQLTDPVSWYPPGELNKTSIEHLNFLKQKSVVAKEKSLQVANDVSALKQEIDLLLENIQSNDNTAFADKIKRLEENINQTEESIKSSLSEQIKIIESTEKIEKSESGWIFLGKVNESKVEWIEKLPTVEDETPRIQAGEILTLRDTTYLRDEPEGRWHTTGKVISVMQVGEKVKVIDELDFSEAKGGGFFAWAKVKKIRNSN